jgi:hypothetical protein
VHTTREGPAAAIDPRWVELVLACLVAGGAFVLGPRFLLVPSLLVPTLAVYAVALLRLVGGRPAGGLPAAAGGRRRGADPAQAGRLPHRVADLGPRRRGGRDRPGGRGAARRPRPLHRLLRRRAPRRLPGRRRAADRQPDPGPLPVLAGDLPAPGPVHGPRARHGVHPRRPLAVPARLCRAGCGPGALEPPRTGRPARPPPAARQPAVPAGLLDGGDRRPAARRPRRAGLGAGPGAAGAGRARPRPGAVDQAPARAVRAGVPGLARRQRAAGTAAAAHRRPRGRGAAAARRGDGGAVPAVASRRDRRGCPAVPRRPGAPALPDQRRRLPRAAVRPRRRPRPLGGRATVVDPAADGRRAGGRRRVVWRRTKVADLLAAGAAVSLTSVYFSRAFTTTYWWLPVALLSLAAVAAPRPRPWEAARGTAGPVVRELPAVPAPAVAAAVPERTSRPAR